MEAPLGLLILPPSGVIGVYHHIRLENVIFYFTVP